MTKFTIEKIPVEGKNGLFTLKITPNWRDREIMTIAEIHEILSQPLEDKHMVKDYNDYLIKYRELQSQMHALANELEQVQNNCEHKETETIRAAWDDWHKIEYCKHCNKRLSG